MDLVAIVSKWAAINSGTYNLSGLDKCADELEKSFSLLEGVCQRNALAEDEGFDHLGKRIKRPLGKVLMIGKRPEAPFQILLVGHMDTVFHSSHDFQQVIPLEGNRLQGPGVADMKGGLLVMLKSLEAFEKCSEAKSIGWKVIINPDEEIGSPGSKQLLMEEAKKCDIGLVFEPALEDGSFVSARGGSANYTVVSKGVAAHVGRDFFKGENAIVSLAQFICELEKFRKPCIVNVGEIKGGHATNCVPDYAWCTLTVRFTKISEFEKIDQWLRAPPEAITVHQMSFRPPKPFDKKTKHLFELLKECGKKIGINIHWQKSGGVCDGNLLASVGLPTIDTLGVRGGHLHSTTEFLWIDSIHERIALTIELLKTLAKKNLWENY